MYPQGPIVCMSLLIKACKRLVTSSPFRFQCVICQFLCPSLVSLRGQRAIRAVTALHCTVHPRTVYCTVYRVWAEHIDDRLRYTVLSLYSTIQQEICSVQCDRFSIARHKEAGGRDWVVVVHINRSSRGRGGGRGSSCRISVSSSASARL